MHHVNSFLLFVALTLGLASGAQADWSDTLKQAAAAANNANAGSPGKAAITSGLTSGEMNGGLKDALAVGAERAINGLGRPGGYFADHTVRIPLPGPLKKLEDTLRMLGQGKLVDEFEQSINRAAEQAVPKAAPIVGNAIRGMSVSDAKAILTGPDDAATRYFRDKTSGALASSFLPVVKTATDSTGATRSFKKLVDKTGGALGGDLDLDKYVTGKTLDGLFLKLANEEKAIRQNPAARSTDLLKKVFGRK